MLHPNASLTQHEVDELLRQSGLLRLRAFDSRLLASASASASASAAALRVQAASFAGPVLLSLFGEELADLVPSSLACAQVLYFVLPPSMERLLPQLLAASWDCYGDLTDHPWAHAVYVALRAADGEHPAIPEARPLLAIRSDAIDLSRAFSEGFAILMFECAGVLWTRGIPVGEDLGIDLSACAQSTFQRPLRIHSVKGLQQRTRLVEETGVDPAGPPNGGHPVLPVLCSRLARRQPFDASQLPEHKKRQLPRARWCRISDAVIGWLPEVTHFQEECAGESHLVLKVTVEPDMYGRIQAGDFSARVQLAAPSPQTADRSYVLLVQSGQELAVVTMPLSDRRFSAAYRYWSRVGSCQVACENLHNGRLHRIRVSWPATRPLAGDGVHGPSDFEDGSRLGCRPAADALVHAYVHDAEVFLTCYISGVTDQEDWRRKSEEA